jgi:hypothetical protein
MFEASHVPSIVVLGSELRVFAQVLANREYCWLDQSDISGLIIDWGEKIGLSTLYFLRRFPNAHLVALEPDPIT